MKTKCYCKTHKKKTTKKIYGSRHCDAVKKDTLFYAAY